MRRICFPFSSESNAGFSVGGLPDGGMLVGLCGLLSNRLFVLHWHTAGRTKARIWSTSNDGRVQPQPSAPCL